MKLVLTEGSMLNVYLNNKDTEFSVFLVIAKGI